MHFTCFYKLRFKFLCFQLNHFWFFRMIKRTLFNFTSVWICQPICFLYFEYLGAWHLIDLNLSRFIICGMPLSFQFWCCILFARVQMSYRIVDLEMLDCSWCHGIGPVYDLCMSSFTCEGFFLIYGFGSDLCQFLFIGRWQVCNHIILFWNSWYQIIGYICFGCACKAYAACDGVKLVWSCWIQVLNFFSGVVWVQVN